MKKFAMLMLVCGLVVSANAATLQLADYVASPDFDAAANLANTSGSYTYGPVSASPALGWYPEGYDGHINYVNVGSEADSGDQVVSMLTHSAYGSVSLKAHPQEYLNPGDTWEFTFKAKKDDLLNVWVATASDISVFMLDGVGTPHGMMTIPGSSLTTEWQEFTYSDVYTGVMMWPGGWTMYIRAVAGPDFQAVCIDTVAAVPEPATMSLIGLGVLALIRRRK